MLLTIVLKWLSSRFSLDYHRFVIAFLRHHFSFSLLGALVTSLAFFVQFEWQASGTPKCGNSISRATPDLFKNICYNRGEILIGIAQWCSCTRVRFGLRWCSFWIPWRFSTPSDDALTRRNFLRSITSNVCVCVWGPPWCSFWTPWICQIAFRADRAIIRTQANAQYVYCFFEIFIHIWDYASGH